LVINPFCHFDPDRIGGRNPFLKAPYINNLSTVKNVKRVVQGIPPRQLGGSE
jgi:hypothetical protein